MFRPSPCLTHYGERLATTPSADFCLITPLVAQRSAIGFHLIRSPLAMDSKGPRLGRPVASLVICRSLVKQISPDSFQYPLEGYKSMSCHYTAASFTVAVRSRGFDVLDPKHFVGPALPSRLQPTPQMMFLFISSQFRLKRLLLVRPASFRPNLTV